MYRGDASRWKEKLTLSLYMTKKEILILLAFFIPWCTGNFALDGDRDMLRSYIDFLLSQCTIDNTDRLRAALDLGCHPNRLLYLAVEQNQRESVKILLKAGANPNIARDEDGATPLHEAALLHNMGCVRDLVAGGANINAKDKEGNTPLQYALRSSSSDEERFRISMAFCELGADMGAAEKK